MDLIEKINNKNFLLDEIRYGMPNKRMMELVSVGAFEFNGKLIVVKSRYTDKDLPRMIEAKPFIYYDNYPDDNYNFNHADILSKNVVFDRGLLNRRALLSLMKLVELMDDDVIVAYNGSHYERVKF